ncbi:hypothetical protein OG788_43685 [Streptomyces sp. NBC_00647]|uniref:hypothetical protein n=1 Tax=Streptomyces sp. NBC_00647 TaxID=2975796 RepID=UPI0032496AB1
MCEGCVTPYGNLVAALSRIEIQRKFSGGSWTVMASTRGHSVVGDSYCTFWETDNMDEDTLLQVRVCIVEGEHSTCSEARYSYA